MKKFFRVALVCALAGATLLYTSCTKDYSEDISYLQKELNTANGNITDLTGRVQTLENAKTLLEQGLGQAAAALEKLEPRVDTLEQNVAELQRQKDSLLALIQANAGDIDTLKARVNAIDTLISGLQDQINTINGQIDTLKRQVADQQKAIDSLKIEKADVVYVDSLARELSAAIAQKADKIYVDSLAQVLVAALEKKADKTYVDSLAQALTDAISKKADQTYVDSLAEALAQELAKKADSVWVQTELDKKADIDWVTKTLKDYATQKALIDTAAALRGAIGALGVEINNVRTDLANLSDEVDDLGKYVAKVADSVQINAAAIKNILTEVIPPMQNSISILQGEMLQAKIDIVAAQTTADAAKDSAALALRLTRELDNFLKTNYYDAKTVDRLLNELEGRVKDSLAKKLDITVWQKDTARINAQFAEIDRQIKEVIKNYQAADDYLHFRIDSLDTAIQGLLDLKLDKSTFEEYVAAIRTELDNMHMEINKLLARVQSIVYVPEYDDDRITLNWAQMYEQNLFDTRDLEEPLPPSFDEDAWKDFYQALLDNLNGISEGVDGAIVRELYDVVSQGLLIANFPTVGSPYVSNGRLPIQAMLLPPAIWSERFGHDDYAAKPIVEPSHVKYRIMGKDADLVVEGLVAEIKEGNEDILSFDVVRVKTRVNHDGVKLNIVGAQIDDQDPCTIDLTVVPEGLPDDFWLYTWDVKNFMNPKLHILYYQYLFMQHAISNQLYEWLYQQITGGASYDVNDIEPVTVGGNNEAEEEEEETTAVIVDDSEFPAFSVSLVLTHVTDTTDWMITSAYNNVVPSDQPDEIELRIFKDDVDITGKIYADTVDIEYIDLSDTVILGNTELRFSYNGKIISYDEFTALGMNLGDPIHRYRAVEDYSKAIDEAAVQACIDEYGQYFCNSADDNLDVPEAVVHLQEVVAGGVGSCEKIVLTYFLGPAMAQTYGLVRVVPVQVAVTIDLWENEELVPFTWNYETDAAVDAAIFDGSAVETGPFYQRDSAWADDAEAIAILEGYDVTLDDFAGKEPVDSLTVLTLYSHKADGTVISNSWTLKDLLALIEAGAPVVNIDPFFDDTNDGKLMANVTNFLFYDFTDPEVVNDSLKYTAIYNLPSNETPYLEVTVNGQIKFADRDRRPIIVNLPETFEPFVVDYKQTILDTLNVAAETINPEIGWPNGTYAQHSLTDENLIDAYDRGYGRTDSLTMTVNGEDITKFAKTLIVTTVSEDVENHVLDYNTNSNFNVSWAANKEIEPYQTFQSIDTLWYGQLVIVNKTVRLDVDGIYEFERIPEYVDKIDDTHYYTELQPWWKPDAATLEPYDVPVNGYDAHEVLLNQHFRVIDVLKSVEAGEKVWATAVANVAGTPEELDDDGAVVTEATEGITAGDLLPEYVDILARIFKLEEVGPVGEEVEFIADPRAAEQPELITALETLINKNREEDDQVTMGVTITTDSTNVVSYYSESEQEDAVGKLYGVNKNGSYVLLTTNFNRAVVADDKTSAEAAARLAAAGVVNEDYSQYVIKKFDPLFPIEEPEGEQEINANNSVIRPASIYQFIQLKDKRGYNLIGPNVYGEDEYGAPIYVYGWLTGNVDPATKLAVNEDEEPNGFEDGVKTNEVYSLVFTHELEYLSEVSPETQARINFDPETGIITFDNTLQTQLKVPIRMKLNIKVEYPWNTQTATVYLKIYNKPVGTADPEPEPDPETPEEPAPVEP